MASGGWKEHTFALYPLHDGRDTTALALELSAVATTPYGCPMFAPAYVGRKRWATRISYFTELARTADAVSLKGNRMISINATNLDRKSGGSPPQPFVPDLPVVH